MKSLILAILILCSHTAFASIYESTGCKAPSTDKVDNDSFFAQVVSQSHMELELIFVLKNNYGAKVKILGGKSYDTDTLPPCSSDDLAPVTWLQPDRFATHSVSGGSSLFTAAYRICIFDIRGRLMGSSMVCNAEVGD